MLSFGLSFVVGVESFGWGASIVSKLISVNVGMSLCSYGVSYEISVSKSVGSGNVSGVISDWGVGSVVMVLWGRLNADV